MLDQIRMVLVNTSHPGNIGSCARAMKTMNLSQLYLVAPKLFPHPKALEMASAAADLVEHATVVTTLDEAIADCHLVIGTSTRMRSIPWPFCTPCELAETVKKTSPETKIAILFGREQSGLTNDELHRCHLHVQIPANPAYSSLNISQAVQVIAYELYIASLADTQVQSNWDYRLATAGELESFFNHLQDVLIKLQFLKLSAPRQLMTRLRRLFFRANIDVMEMNILRGILSAIDDSLEKVIDRGTTP